jgi:hypothetical protein
MIGKDLDPETDPYLLRIYGLGGKLITDPSASDPQHRARVKVNYLYCIIQVIIINMISGYGSGGWVSGGGELCNQHLPQVRREGNGNHQRVAAQESHTRRYR